jgi:hypothetical protein
MADLLLLFLRVVSLAAIAHIRAFPYKQSRYCTEIDYVKGTAPTESASRWAALCDRGGEVGVQLPLVR